MFQVDVVAVAVSSPNQQCTHPPVFSHFHRLGPAELPEFALEFVPALLSHDPKTLAIPLDFREPLQLWVAKY